VEVRSGRLAVRYRSAFADALHWACGRGCERLVTFDDRRLARRARRLGLAPEIVLSR